jgi:cytochrome c553
MNQRAIAAIAASLAVAWAATVAGQQPPAPPPSFAPANVTPNGVRAMAANCAACHGTEGRPVEGSSVAALAGRPQADIVEAMKAFKEGKREATVMHQIAKGYSDAEIAAIAGYFSQRR